EPIANSQEPIAKRERRSPRGTRLALDALPDDWRRFCEQERPDLDPERTFRLFIDYWTAKPGKDGVKLDWEATWRNWVRREKSGSRPNGNGHSTPEKWRHLDDDFGASGEDGKPVSGESR